ncbi:MAG: small metal-binding protein SmbP [Methylobacter sp.]
MPKQNLTRKGRRSFSVFLSRTQVSLASAIVLKGTSQKRMESASSHLEDAINEGDLGHTDQAKLHVNAAITEIQGANT